jgi:hypothetical protein
MDSETDISSKVPPELRTFYDSLYSQVLLLISGNAIADLKNPTSLKILFQAAIQVLNDIKNTDGNGWTTEQKEQIALNLLQYVISDLSAKGKINPDTAQEILGGLDLWGGVILAITNDIIVKGEVFEQDVEKVGCKGACQKDCCNIF